MNIDELSKKYNIHKILLRGLEKEYGSIDIFKEKYINALIKDELDKLKISKQIKQNLITYFDLSEPTGIGKNDGYIKLANNILDRKIISIIDTNFRDVMNALILKLPDKERDIIELSYGINKEPKPSREICEKYNISREGVRIKKEKAIKRIKKSDEFQKLKNSFLIFENEEQELIQQFFKSNDIFFNPESQENKAIELFIIGYEIKIDNLKFESYEECLNTTKELIQELSNVEIDNNIKNMLVKKINNKKLEYENENQWEVVYFYEYKIDRTKKNIKLKTLYDKRITDLKLPIKVTNSLEKNNIHTIKDLVDKTEEELLNIENIGINVLEHISKKLSLLDVNFAFKKDNYIDNYYSLEELYDEIKDVNVSEKNKKHLLCKLKGKNIQNSNQQNYLKKYIDKIDNVPTFIENEEILDMKIRDLNMSLRTFNCLARANVSAVIELVNISEEKLKNIRTMGEKSYEEIKEKLASYGIKILTTEEIKQGKYYIKYSDLQSQIQRLDIDDENKKILLSRLEERKPQVTKNNIDNKLNDAIENLQGEYKKLSQIQSKTMEKKENDEHLK